MISNIIRNKNESELLVLHFNHVLISLANRIIIVDNNSTDDSLDIVQNFNNRTEIKIKKIDMYKPGESINKGVKYASNNIF